MTGFQKQVQVQPASAVAGDFASGNPRYYYVAGPGGLVAGDDVVIIAHFAWVTNPDDADGAPATVWSHGYGPVAGLVHRNQQGLITDFLAESGMEIKPGYGMALQISGDMWLLNDGATPALPGMKVYADFADGSASAAATGSPAGGGSATGTIAAGTAAFVGSIDDDTLTVTAVTQKPIIGGLLTGTDGVHAIATGTTIVEAIDVNPDGTGTYAVSIGEQTVDSCAITETYGLFTAVSALSGTFGVGQPLAGSGGGGVVAGTVITALGTGVGGLGTYYVNKTQTVTSSTITSASNVETKWFVRSTAQPGELMKIDDQPLG